MSDRTELNNSHGGNKQRDDTRGQEDSVPPIDQEVADQQAAAIQDTANVESDGPVSKTPPTS